MNDSFDPPPIVVPTRPMPRKIHPAIRKVWMFGALISLVFSLPIFAAIEYVLISNWEPYPFNFPIVGPLLAIGSAIWSLSLVNRQYESWTYELREHDLVMNWGVFWKTRRCIARDRVQHVDINSGPMDRRFGLVQMSIYAAGAMGAVGTIPGLDPNEAEKIRKSLLEHRAASG